MELRLKKQEYDLQLKKDELKLEMEYAKAMATEGAYAQAEAKYLASSDLDSQPHFCVPPSASDIKGATDSTKHQAPQNVPPVKESSKQSKISSSSMDSIKSDLSDQAYQILVQQNRVMEEFVKQKQRNTLPRRRVPTFDGNPLEYCTFMRAFETVIEDKEPDYAGRLYYLEQHTAGRAQEMVRSCLYMEPKERYLKAKKLLESKFGQKHQIAMAYVDQVTKGPPIKEEDAVSLEGYSIPLTSCTNTLKAIGYSKKLEGPDNMRKIIQRLPPRLQISWRNNADRIINMEGREVCIEDISLFVGQKSRALNDPVFGKLPCLTKEKKNSKDKGTKSKADCPGTKQLSFVTLSDKNPTNLSDKNPPNPSEKNPPNPVKDVSGPSGSVTNPADSSKKNSPFCRETHNLSDCPSFAKVPDQERFEFVMKQRLCFSCLRGGHQSRGCYKKKPCTHCHGRHATVMHVHPLENSQVQPRPEVGVREAPAESGGNRAQGNVVLTGTQQGSTERFCGLTTMEGFVTALPIAPVKIKVRGSPHCIETYALLDNGSNSTFCSVSLLECTELMARRRD